MRGRLLGRVAREPLVHFLVLGAVLFGVDAVGRRRRDQAQPAPAAPAAAAAPGTTPASARRITVTPDDKRRLVEEATASRGKAPSASETAELVARWVDEEILYREGLERGFDRDDPRVRQRIAQKMSRVLEASQVPPKPTEEDLRRLFAEQPERWSRAELVDFTHVFVSADAGADGRAATLAAQLSSGADPSGLGETFSGGRRYRRRAISDLTDIFGPEFTSGLAEQKEGTWVVRRSRFGHHVVRVDKRTAARTPSFDEARGDVEMAWLEARRREQHAASIAELRKRWVVEVAP